MFVSNHAKPFLFIALVAIAFFASACPEDKTTPGGGLLSFDETTAAGNIVEEVNRVKLRPIKQRFKDNEPRLLELQEALKAKDVEKVRTVANTLILEINAGVTTGNEAIEKLKTARDMNINADYREYLQLKIDALNKYIEAFEERRKAAIVLRDGFDPKNAAKREQVIGMFKQHEEKFKEIMEEARQVSEEANRLAKESLNRQSS